MYERIGRLACHTKLHGVAGVVLRGSSEDCLSQAVTDQEGEGLYSHLGPISFILM